jgi:hypothetical protein
LYNYSEGGGTVFSDLFVDAVAGAAGVAGGGGGAARCAERLVARPEAGHAAVFKGHLQHGGAPVTAGVRYIVAAFLFVE